MMQRSTEIRNLTTHLEVLGSILDTGEGWRTLLFLIPSNLNDLYTRDYTRKYTGEHERLLLEAVRDGRHSPSLVLLEEWGTSGRVRPTVEHLLTLLIRSEQFRAADYLTRLLKEKPPDRPKEGPAAPVDIRLPEDHRTESLLEDIGYPSSTLLVDRINSLTIENNRDYYEKMGPHKRIEMQDFAETGHEVASSKSDVDLLVFSSSEKNSQYATESSDMNIPAIIGMHADLPGPSGIAQRVAAVVTLSDNTQSSTSDSTSDEARDLTPDASSAVKPEVRSGLSSSLAKIEEETDQALPIVTLLNNSSATDLTIPHISGLMNSDQQHSDALPRLSLMKSLDSSSSRLVENGYILPSSHRYSNSNSGSLNFSMPALIEAFEYGALSAATNSFDQTPFSNKSVDTPDGHAIGRGGFGEVFLALNISPSIPIAAVKRLDPEKYKYREKFQLELDILSKHSNDNIVKLLGYSSDGPNLCMVYEYLSDGNLEDALSHARNQRIHLAPLIRVRYLRDIASAIAYLHNDAKIMHRDVKSANILLQGAVAKLCDFGLIKLSTSKTSTSIIGTNAYMAPEAVRGDISNALDVFAFGTVIAEVTTGEPVLVEPGMRNEIDLAGYIRRHRGEGKDLQLLVDGRASPDGQWMTAGVQLLNIAIDCLDDKWRRPEIGPLVEKIGRIQGAMEQ